MTYTLARLVVPRSVHELIGRKLRAAGYDHAFHGDTIDMTHIGLEREVGPPLRTGPLTASMDNVLASRLGDAFAAAAAETKIGDQIDRGLVLLRELHALGFDVVLAARPDAAAGELIEVARAISAMVSGMPRRPDPHGYLSPIGLAILANVERLLGGGGSCERPATVEIRPSEPTSYEDYTHACERHVGELLGHRDVVDAPDHYQVRHLADAEIVGPPSLRCCYPGAAVPVPVPVAVDEGAPAIGAAP